MSRFAKAGLADQLSKNPCQNIISAEIDALGLVLRRHTQQFSSFQNLCLPILDTVRVSSHAITAAVLCPQKAKCSLSSHQIQGELLRKPSDQFDMSKVIAEFGKKSR